MNIVKYLFAAALSLFVVPCFAQDACINAQNAVSLISSEPANVVKAGTKVTISWDASAAEDATLIWANGTITELGSDESKKGKAEFTVADVSHFNLIASIYDKNTDVNCQIEKPLTIFVKASDLYVNANPPQVLPFGAVNITWSATQRESGEPPKLSWTSQTGEILANTLDASFGKRLIIAPNPTSGATAYEATLSQKGHSAQTATYTVRKYFHQAWFNASGNHLISEVFVTTELDNIGGYIVACAANGLWSSRVSLEYGNQTIDVPRRIFESEFNAQDGQTCLKLVRLHSGFGVVKNDHGHLKLIEYVFKDHQFVRREAVDLPGVYKPSGDLIVVAATVAQKAATALGQHDRERIYIAGSGHAHSLNLDETTTGGKWAEELGLSMLIGRHNEREIVFHDDALYVFQTGSTAGVRRLELLDSNDSLGSLSFANIKQADFPFADKAPLTGRPVSLGSRIVFVASDKREGVEQHDYALDSTGRQPFWLSCGHDVDGTRQTLAMVRPEEKARTLWVTDAAGNLMSLSDPSPELFGCIEGPAKPPAPVLDRLLRITLSVDNPYQAISLIAQPNATPDQFVQSNAQALEKPGAVTVSAVAAVATSPEGTLLQWKINGLMPSQYDDFLDVTVSRTSNAKSGWMIRTEINRRVPSASDPHGRVITTLYRSVQELDATAANPIISVAWPKVISASGSAAQGDYAVLANNSTWGWYSVQSGGTGRPAQIVCKWLNQGMTGVYVGETIVDVLGTHTSTYKPQKDLRGNMTQEKTVIETKVNAIISDNYCQSFTLNTDAIKLYFTKDEDLMFILKNGEVEHSGVLPIRDRVGHQRDIWRPQASQVVSAGYNGAGRGYFLHTDGHVSQAFAAQAPGELSKPGEWRFMTAGANGAYFIDKERRLWSLFELGRGYYDGSKWFSSPRGLVIFNDEKNWDAVAIGADMDFGIKSDGTLWAWGNVGRISCQNGAPLQPSLVPVQVDAAHRWLQILPYRSQTDQAKRGVALAISEDGSLWRIGRRDSNTACAKPPEPVEIPLR